MASVDARWVWVVSTPSFDFKLWPSLISGHHETLHAHIREITITLMIAFIRY